MSKDQSLPGIDAVLMVVSHWLLLVGVAVGACSAGRERIEQRADDDLRVPGDVAGSAAGTSGAHRSAEADTAADEQGRPLVHSSGESVSSTSLAGGVESQGNEMAACPPIGVTVPLERLGETNAEVRLWDGSDASLNVAAEVIWTPGNPRDPNEAWPGALSEEDWDRSATPLASCTILLRALPVDCYDTTSSSLFIDPAGERSVGYNNLSDPSLGFNSPARCDFEPGCRYPFERGVIDGYYIVSEGSDTRVVICGMKCDEHGVGTFSLAPKISSCDSE